MACISIPVLEMFKKSLQLIYVLTYCGIISYKSILSNALQLFYQSLPAVTPNNDPEISQFMTMCT